MPHLTSNRPPTLAAATTPAVAAPATTEAPIATVRVPVVNAGRTVFSPRKPNIRNVSPATGPSKYSAPCPSKTPLMPMPRPTMLAVASPVVVRLMKTADETAALAAEAIAGITTSITFYEEICVSFGARCGAHQESAGLAQQIHWLVVVIC